jgi:hypothetical protein
LDTNNHKENNITKSKPNRTRAKKQKNTNLFSSNELGNSISNSTSVNNNRTKSIPTNIQTNVDNYPSIPTNSNHLNIGINKSLLYTLAEKGTSLFSNNKHQSDEKGIVKLIMT